MTTLNLYRARIGYALMFIVALLSTGCGGGASSSGNTSPTSNVTIQADPGRIVAIRLGEVATLDGSGSSTSTSYPLAYNWSFSSKPVTSKTTLQNSTSVSPSFTADVTGTYMVELIVSAGSQSSQRTIASVEVTNQGEDLTGKRVHTRYSSQCADCHDGRFAKPPAPLDPVPPKSGVHLATSNMCQACHTTFGFDIIRHADHLEVFSDCSSCHNGVSAVAKSEFHVTTNAECNDCHSTNSFLDLGADGRFDHANITRACATCHDGTIAIGKHNAHKATPANTDCAFCHTTTNFKDYYVDHSNITGNCASCHNGTDATGPKVGHPVLAVDCGTCHTTTRFSLGGVFSHRVDSTVQACSGCHNDNNSINARGKSAIANHPATTADCGVCHGLGGGNFADGIYDHTGIVNNCVSCHGVNGNGSGPGKSANHIPTNSDCSVCHTTGTFKTGVYDHDPTIVNLVTCDSCHNSCMQ